MQHIETPYGKLFYCVYNLYQKSQINEKQRNKLKDLIIRNQISFDDYNMDKLPIQLLDIATNASDEELSTKKITPRNQIRPFIALGHSNFKLSSRSQSQLRSSPIYMGQTQSSQII